jgi:hypothetical protein
LKTLRSVAGELYRVTSYCDTYDALAETNNAIMDIQQARSAPVQKRPQNCGTGYCSCVECVMEPAPVQEPVAWRWTNGKGWLTYGEMPHDRFESTPLYTAAQQAPVQEPVALGKPTDEMVQAATDEYDEWAFDNKGTTECIRAMLVKALKVQPAAQPAPVKPVAQAWDEGYRAGIDDERTSEASIGIAGFDAKVEPARNNPYCTTPPAQPAPVREDWGPGPHEYHSLPAPVQEPFGYLEIDDIESQREYPNNCRNVNLWHEGGEGMVAIYTTPPAAQRQCTWPTCQSEEYQQALAEQINQELVTGAAQPAPDYAWPTVADYEKDVGFEVNEAFKMAWAMARTTNALFT